MVRLTNPITTSPPDPRAPGGAGASDWRQDGGLSLDPVHPAQAGGPSHQLLVGRRRDGGAEGARAGSSHGQSRAAVFDWRERPDPEDAAHTTDGAWLIVSLSPSSSSPASGSGSAPLFCRQLPGAGREPDLVFAPPPQSLSERAADALIKTRLLLDEHHHIPGRIAKRLAAYAAHPCRVARVGVAIRDESHSLYQAAYVERL
jgi:hypothetical protein